MSTTLRDRNESVTRPSGGRTKAQPVLLATTAVPVHPSAERVAFDSAIEAGVPLVLVNVIPLPLYVRTMVLVGPEGTTLPHEEALDEVRASASRAARLGLETELLRVRTRHAATALLEIAGERDVGLLVFGPDASGMTRLQAKRTARRLRRDATCLLWLRA